MTYDELAALLHEGWSNEACRGYMILCMEAAGVEQSKIHDTIMASHDVFDMISTEEAARRYITGNF